MVFFALTLGESFFRVLGAVGGVLCGLCILGWSWIRQYQALADDEPEIALVPDGADITYCTMDGVPLEMDMYYPENCVLVVLLISIDLKKFSAHWALDIRDSCTSA